MPKDVSAADIIVQFIRDRLNDGLQRPLVIGLCGAQGSGKSTVSAQIQDRLAAIAIRTAVLSLDDLYLTRAERLHLAHEVHPLFATRGPPGTHDVRLGLSVLADLRAGRPVNLPRFDKSVDDRRPESEWESCATPVDVIVFEGWCVGATAQSAAALIEPVNALERHEDPGCVWRTYANTALATDYADLFGALSHLVLLAAPSFEVVSDWRRQQEHDLKARLAAAGQSDGMTMSDAEVDRFIQYYERLTRHILREMPGRADLTIRLDAQRRIDTGAL